MALALSIVGICIALAAFSVSLMNFRLSRFPHVRVHPTFSYGESIEHPKDHILTVVVESWGLPVYDMRVMLKADYTGHHREIGNLEIGVEPVGTLPNPMNPGQVAKFRVYGENVREIDDDSWTFKRTFGLSDLPPEKVSLCVYGSGGRLLKKIPATKFDLMFPEFDTKKAPIQPAQPSNPSKITVTELPPQIRI